MTIRRPTKPPRQSDGLARRATALAPPRANERADEGEDLRPTSPRLEEPVYLSVREVAELFQVAEKTIYSWIKLEPTMPALKLAGTVRFPKARLLAWLKTREQGPGRPRIRKQVLSLPKPTSSKGAADD
jgi:excisionase family DNA binding protein